MIKKSKIALLLATIFALSIFVVGCGKDKQTGDLKEVKLCEVVRSVFYAPMYVAINEGFFEEEGLAVDLSTGHAE